MNYNIMLIRHFAQGPFATRLLSGISIAIASTLTTVALAAPADDLREASKLYQQNRFDQALAKVGSVLAQTPKDAQGRFLKGLILTEQKKIAEAIQVFTSITEDFPELPEPYNNLAVLYAGQGNYDKAKAALELAIHTHPTYATAHENLGDIYAQLARRAYDKALQLDKSNSAAQSKLSMVKELFGAPRSAAVAVAAKPAAPAVTAPVVVAAATPAATPAVTSPASTAAPSKPTTVAVAPTAKPAVVNGNAEADVSATVRDWAAAWAGQNVDGYLSYYAADFVPADGSSRKAWKRTRKERLEAPTSISVEIQDPKITINGNEATVQFRQKYRSDIVTNDARKTLKLVKSGERWMIRAEQAGA
jgi:tetratricopeptide (TPR) repeat protein